MSSNSEDGPVGRSHDPPTEVNQAPNMSDEVDPTSRTTNAPPAVAPQPAKSGSLTGPPSHGTPPAGNSSRLAQVRFVIRAWLQQAAGWIPATWKRLRSWPLALTRRQRRRSAFLASLGLAALGSWLIYVAFYDSWDPKELCTTKTTSVFATPSPSPAIPVTSTTETTCDALMNPRFGLLVTGGLLVAPLFLRVMLPGTGIAGLSRASQEPKGAGRVRDNRRDADDRQGEDERQFLLELKMEMEMEEQGAHEDLTTTRANSDDSRSKPVPSPTDSAPVQLPAAPLADPTTGPS